MQRIAEGDRAALDGLYHRYSGMVFALCLRIVSDRGAAEDLLTEVFFELWRKSSRYDSSRGAPITYITTLARSRAIDRKRSRATRHEVVAGDTSAFEAAGTDPRRVAVPDPQEQAALTERADKVRAILSRLDSDHRQTLELSYFEGLSHSEIAERLGKPLGTVKTHIRTGIIRMRELLRMEP